MLTKFCEIWHITFYGGPSEKIKHLSKIMTKLFFKMEWLT